MGAKCPNYDVIFNVDFVCGGGGGRNHMETAAS